MEIKKEDNDINHDRNNEEKQKLETMLKIVNEAWEDEVTSLLEQFKNDNTDLFEYDLKDLKSEMRKELNKKKKEILNIRDSNMKQVDYKILYNDLVQSKLELIDKTSQEIQKLRQIIYDQNNETYKNIFDRIVRYHNLDGGGEANHLYQLIVDAKLKDDSKIK